MIFLNNVNAPYKQYSIYNLNSENNVLLYIYVQTKWSKTFVDFVLISNFLSRGGWVGDEWKDKISPILFFLNNVNAQYKQYSIYNLNSENNVLFIQIVLQINSSGCRCSGYSTCNLLACSLNHISRIRGNINDHKQFSVIWCWYLCLSCHKCCWITKQWQLCVNLHT
jgi:hypothetical protein